MRTSRLAALYEAEGPFASVTVDVSQDGENAAHEKELRARAACEALAEQGADDAAVSLVASRLAENVTEPAPVARVVVATRDSVLLDELIHTRVDQPIATWGPLPDVTAWLERQDRAVSFVLAVVDHVGGDVGTYSSEVPEAQEERSVGGETHHVHKVPTGGWSALRYQHVTENVWSRNAEAVADEIESHVRSGYRLVLLAGDPQSRSRVVDRLGDTSATVIQLETGSRSEDGGEAAFQQAVRQALMEHTVAERLELAHTVKDRLGRDVAVATGVRDIADAFVRGQVDTLLLDPAAAADLTLTPGDHPGLVLGTAPVDQPLPAGQALVAAAALTGADVRVSPAGTLGGAPVVALLRWDQAAVGTAAG
jgi:hypothetical protein